MSPTLFSDHGPSRMARAIPRFGERVRHVLGRALLIGVLLVVCGGAGWVVWRLYGFVTASSFFELRDLQVRFAQTPPGLDAPGRMEHQLRGMLEREGLSSGNLLKLDAARVEKTVTGAPWVRSASVSKHYPKRLEVTVHPRCIEAMVLHDPILAVDGEGVVVAALTTRHRLASDFPYVTGLELHGAALGGALASASLTKSLDLLSCLRSGNPSLYARASEVHCDPESNLVLVLKGGTEIRFGAENPILKMPILETFIARKGAPSQFVYIDLRFEGQVPYLSRSRATAQGDSVAR